MKSIYINNIVQKNKLLNLRSYCIIRKVLFFGLLFCSFPGLALKAIPEPDLSLSKEYIVKKHNEVINKFNHIKTKLKGVKLGSEYGDLGMFYQAHEMTASAIACYENAIELSPYDHRWPYLLGFIEGLQGNFERSNRLYQKTLKINDNYLPAMIRWATNRLESGEFKEAKKLFNQVLEKAPDYSRALAGLGTISMQQGDVDDAIKYFEQTLKLQPNASQINYLLSQAYNVKGQAKKAQYYMQKKGQQPVDMYDKILQEMHLHSVSPVYYAHSAINAFMSKDYSLAEKLAKLSIQMDPKDINPQYTLINVYLTTNRVMEAKALTKKLLKKQPKNEKLHYVLAMTEERTGNYLEAVDAYKAVMKLRPDNKEVDQRLGDAYINLEKYKEALKHYRKAQVVDKENPYPIFAEAMILSYLKVCDKSIIKFKQAISKQPENFTYLTGFVKTVAVCNDKEDKIKEDALNAARNMYAISPTIEVTQALAMIEARVGNQKNAIDYQAQAIFFALSEKRSKIFIEVLKADLELYKKGKTAKIATRGFGLSS